MARRGIPEISAGSMADIAFLLLIFFLVTTTMEKESGMMRLLPEWEQKDPEEVNRRNVIDVLVNDQNKILLKGELVEMAEVKKIMAEIILNETDNANWPENIAVTEQEVQAKLEEAKTAYDNAIPEEKGLALKKLSNAELRVKAYQTFGKQYKKSKHVVSIQSTRGAEYNTYIELSDQILLAYKEARQKIAMNKWSKQWDDLNKEQKQMLKLMIPSNISEAQTVQGQN